MSKTIYLAYAGIKENERKKASHFYSFYSSATNIKNCYFSKKMRAKASHKKKTQTHH
jgi:hypothetical protein